MNERAAADLRQVAYVLFVIVVVLCAGAATWVGFTGSRLPRTERSRSDAETEACGDVMVLISRQIRRSLGDNPEQTVEGAIESLRQASAAQRRDFRGQVSCFAFEMPFLFEPERARWEQTGQILCACPWHHRDGFVLAVMQSAESVDDVAVSPLPMSAWLARDEVGGFVTAR
jgi:hypothetical protein